jgi:class 3 adenylate cyclase
VALAAHDEVLCRAIEEHGGWLFKHTGDGVCAAFASPTGALDAAVAARSWIGCGVLDADGMYGGTGHEHLANHDLVL